MQQLMEEIVKVKIEDLEDCIETQYLLFDGKSLKVRTYVKTNSVLYIVKTIKAEYHLHTLDDAIEIFNDPEN